VARRLRVGIDGRAFSSPAAGVRRYLAGLTPALAASGEVDLVALGGEAGAIPDGLERVPEPAHPPTNAGWAVIGLPRAAARARVDLIHAPAYTGPLHARVPIVLTVHDVSYERHPEWYPYRRDWLRRAFYRRCARAAARILTVSEFSAGEIAAAYRIPRARISVTPHGVSPAFHQTHDVRPEELPVEVSMPFLLHVGDLHERRNLGVALDALLAARRHFGGAAAMSLVLAGVDRGLGDDLCAMAAERDASESVIRLGPVDEAMLHVLYRCATALVYPSRYEGFGLPVLEAMASGTPVIASSAAAVPEVVGDGGVLVDPDDVEAWTDAIVRIANDEHERERLARAGVTRAAAFTWERTARLTIDAYREVMAP
jgi:glycosyltransferase involved in cell wall biosynthesis